MAYNEELAERIRSAVGKEPGIAEKKMFGGLAFLLNGNMCFGIVRDDLMLRVGADAYETALAEPHTRTMDFTGRSMKGMIYVEPEGMATPKALNAWLNKGLTFARTLPPKQPKSRD